MKDHRRQQSFQKSHPLQSWGGGNNRGRHTKLLQARVSIHSAVTTKVPERTQRQRVSENTPHLHVLANQTTECSGGYTKGFREANPGSLSSHSGRAHSVYNPGPTHSAPILSTRESTMDSTVSERHISIGRDNLSDHSDLCWQNQPIQVELEGPNSGTMGHSNSARGLSHSPLVCSPPTISTLQSSHVHKGCSNTGGGDTVPPAEAGHMSNFSPN